MAVPNDSLHEHYHNRDQDDILGLGLLRNGYEEEAPFSHGSSMTSIGGLQTSGLDPAVATHCLQRMNYLGQGAHMTQQFLRENLRVQAPHHASPSQSARPSERSALSSLATQQSGLSQSSERLEMSLNPLQAAQSDFGDFPGSAHTRRAFNTDLALLQGYNTSSRDGVVTLPESRNNLMKASVLGAFLKPTDVGAYFDEQTASVGNNASAISKMKSSSIEAKNVQGCNVNSPWIHETGVFDAGQAVVYSQSSSLAPGASLEANLACSNAANASIETACGPASINLEDGVQPYLLRQECTRHLNSGLGRTDLAPSSGQPCGDENVNLLHARFSTPSSFPTQRNAGLQCFLSSISTPAGDRYGSRHGVPQTTTNYGHSGECAGTELLLLPGSEPVGRPKPSDLHDGNMNPLHRPVSLDEMAYTSPIPWTQWEKFDSRLGNSGSIEEAENVSRGYVRQSPGVLSLFLSSDQRRQSSIPGLEAKFSHSGSLGLLRNSKYLRAAQQVLDEFCSVGRNEFTNVQPNQAEQAPQAWTRGTSTRADDDRREDQATRAQAVDRSMCMASMSARLPSPTRQLSSDERSHLQLKKAQLIGMVEELDKRYRQYRDQMQLVITSFESGTGLGAAVPYTTSARQAMSRRFRSLRDSISDQIQKACKSLGEELSTVPILNRGETPRLRVLDQRLRYQRAVQQIGMLQQHAWRPQRGLPERSVSVLRAWLFEHFLHPYPKDSEKLMLARLTGLSRSQVSNWFINARVRLWKPMVEEMYTEESKEMDEEGTSTGAVDGCTNGQAGKEETTEDCSALANSRQEDGNAKDMASSSFTQSLQVMPDKHNYASDAGGTSDSGYCAYNGGCTGDMKGRAGYYTSATQLQQSSSSLTKETGGSYAATTATQQQQQQQEAEGESRKCMGSVFVNKNCSSMMGGGSSSRNGVTLSLALPNQHVFASHANPLPF